MNYGLNWNSAVSVVDSRLFATVPGEALALGNEEALFRESFTGRAHVMTLQVLQALDLCRAFQSLDQHVAGVCQHIEPLRGQQGAVRKVLESLANRGVLIEASEYVRQLGSVAVAGPSAPGAVIVRTCNRPGALQRCLASALQYERRWLARRRYWILDDSDDARVVASNAERVRHFAEASTCEARSITRADLETYWQRLSGDLSQQERHHASRLLQRDRADPQDAGAYYGRSMNWATLLSAGTQAIWLDDDQILDFRWHPQRSGGFQMGVALGDERTFAVVGEASSAGLAVEEDPLALHTQWCGRSLIDLLTRSPWSPKAGQWAGLAPSQSPLLKPGQRLVSTLNGHRGDTTSGGSDWMMSLPKLAREGWCTSRDSYLAGLSRPEVWQGSARAGLATVAAVTPTCIDAGSLFPAVPRRGRGEDAVFSGLMDCLYPDGSQLEFPMAIEHRRETNSDRRGFSAQARQPAFMGVLSSLLRERADLIRAETPTQRLTCAAALLQDFAAMSATRCRAWLVEYTASLRANEIQRLQSAITEDKQAAVYWLADARALVEANAKALVTEIPLCFADWPASQDESATVSLFQTELRDYGAALHVWPTLFESARTNRLIP
ncbi:MAG: hypothetical protein J0L65_02115 [Xanthomonadales bacterium]|jgi:hypothetical protein|nr:hypothetical protein [Xanthomonadales bacterium]